MLSYMEYLNMPAMVMVTLVAVFFCMQLIGELLEFKGKVVPEIFKIRKYFARKREERRQINKIPEMLESMQESFDAINIHYSKDNIAMRNKWMSEVDNRLNEYDNYIKNIDKKLDKDNDNILSILVDSKRNAIIDFAANVSADKNAPVTRERFNRMFKLYREYEDLIKKNGLTNGEIDIAYRMIVESYEEHMQNHTFIEDVRGWK